MIAYPKQHIASRICSILTLVVWTLVQAVLRSLYAYFADKPLKEVPHIEVLHPSWSFGNCSDQIHTFAKRIPCLLGRYGGSSVIQTQVFCVTPRIRSPYKILVEFRCHSTPSLKYKWEWQAYKKNATSSWKHRVSWSETSESVVV